MPLAAAVAPAQMHADGHPGWRLLQDAVGHGDVFVDESAPIVAARVQPLLDFGIAEFGERRLVDLDVSAAGGAERVELLVKRLDDVVPELIELRVGVRQDSPIAAAKVEGTGAWNGDFWNEPGVRADEFEIREIDWPGPAHAAVDARDRLCAASARLATFGVLAADGIDADLAQLAVKEAVVGAATEFAVRRELQPDALLEVQRVLYRFVFGLGQLGPVDFVAREFRALIEQLAWPQQATDMLSMEWRRVVRQHRRMASLGLSDDPIRYAGGSRCARAPPI